MPVRTLTRPNRFSVRLSAMFAVTSLGLACHAPADSVAESAPGEQVEAAAKPSLTVGSIGAFGQIKAAKLFDKQDGSPKGERYCHVYTYWDVAGDPPVNHVHEKKNPTLGLTGLGAYFKRAAGYCDEVLVSFKGPGFEKKVDHKVKVKEKDGKTVTKTKSHWVDKRPAPQFDQFEKAFVRFQALFNDEKTHPNFAAFRGHVSYTPWNEPNNPAAPGDGLGLQVGPEMAAKYYLAIRRHCRPADGCRVAAGDFASNNPMQKDIEWNCKLSGKWGADGKSCTSSGHALHKGPSYFDKYRHYIDVLAHDKTYGVQEKDFKHPEYVAFHGWYDINSYLLNKNWKCTYKTCVTKRLLASVQDGWSGAIVWNTETGVGGQAKPHHAPSATWGQPCGATFLVRLSKLSQGATHQTRVYYFRYSGGDGPLYNGKTARPAAKVLAGLHTHYSHDGHSCRSGFPAPKKTSSALLITEGDSLDPSLSVDETLDSGTYETDALFGGDDLHVDDEPSVDDDNGLSFDDPDDPNDVLVDDDDDEPASEDATWASLGGTVAGNVSLAPNADGRLMAFAAHPNGTLQHAWRLPVSNAWSGWSTIGSCSSGCGVEGNPTVGRHPDGRLEVFARGVDGTLWHFPQIAAGGGWGDPERWAISIAGDPAVTTDDDGNVYVFARGTDGAVWYVASAATGWDEPVSLGGHITSNPAPIVDYNGALHVFGRDAGGAVQELVQGDDGNWGAWASIGGSVTDELSVIKNDDDELEIFARGTDGFLWHVAQEAPIDAWSPWDSLDPALTGSPRAIINNDGRLDVFARDPDGVLGHTFFDTDDYTWSGWQSLDQAASFDPGLTVNEDGTLEVFAAGANHSVQHARQVEPSGDW